MALQNREMPGTAGACTFQRGVDFADEKLIATFEVFTFGIMPILNPGHPFEISNDV